MSWHLLASMETMMRRKWYQFYKKKVPSCTNMSNNDIIYIQIYCADQYNSNNDIKHVTSDVMGVEMSI